MAPAEAPALIAVEVVYCPRPGRIDLVALQLLTPASVADAVLASRLVQRHALHAADLKLGVWGKPRDADWLLRDRDRVELYRPLTVDPMEARRLRYQRHRDKLVSGNRS